jgi:hypothetical protein
VCGSNVVSKFHRFAASGLAVSNHLRWPSVRWRKPKVSGSASRLRNSSCSILRQRLIDLGSGVALLLGNLFRERDRESNPVGQIKTVIASDPAGGWKNYSARR